MCHLIPAYYKASCCYHIPGSCRFCLTKNKYNERPYIWPTCLYHSQIHGVSICYFLYLIDDQVNFHVLCMKYQYLYQNKDIVFLWIVKIRMTSLWFHFCMVIYWHMHLSQKTVHVFVHLRIWLCWWCGACTKDLYILVATFYVFSYSQIPLYNMLFISRVLHIFQLNPFIILAVDLACPFLVAMHVTFLHLLF